MFFEHANAFLCDAEGKRDAAAKKLDDFVKKYADLLAQPDNRYLYEGVQRKRAFLLLDAERFSEALPLLLESLQFPQDASQKAEVFSRLGSCYIIWGEFDLAKLYLADGAKLATLPLNTFWVRYFLGVANYRLGMLEEAKQQFLMCERIAETNKLPLDNLYIWLSATYRRLKQPGEAAGYKTQ